MSYPHRKAPGSYLGDFLAPPTPRTSPATRPSSRSSRPSWASPYRPWSTAVHDGGREAEALDELTDFLEHHLKAVSFLARRGRLGPVHVST